MSSATSLPKEYKVLFLDCFSYRHTQFRIRTKNSLMYIPHQRHVHNLKEFNAAILEGNYAVMFLPNFLNTKEETAGMVNSLIGLPDNFRPKLLVFHGTSDFEHIIPSLKNDGYLIAHVPWDFVNPAIHNRIK